MKFCCGLLGNVTLDARLAGDETSVAPGRQVVVLESEEVLPPEDAKYGEFSIVEATRRSGRVCGRPATAYRTGTRASRRGTVHRPM